MEWDQSPVTLTGGAQMTEKPQTLSFFGRRSFVPRPMSEATVIFDTDNEDDVTDDESTPQSMGSLELDDDSQTTVSTPPVRTPTSGGLGGFEFHFDDKPVMGPSGPHLFPHLSRVSTESLRDLQVSEGLGLSPVFQARPSSPLNRAVTEEFQSLKLSEKVTLPQTPQTRPFSSLNRAVAELDESRVRSWSPGEVANWMQESGFEASVVEKFLAHDISGTVLLDLKFEDLKELDIISYGKRHRVMSSIHQLRSSTMITGDCSLSTSPSKRGRPQQEHTPEHAPETIRNHSQRRGRRTHRDREVQEDIISPGESVSIVAIEQLLPKQHSCSKGENCSKWQKQQRKLQRLQEELCGDSSPDRSRLLVGQQDHRDAQDHQSFRPSSDAAASVVASSDLLGPSLPEFDITAEKLNELSPRDPQENVLQFLSFQHLHSASPVNAPSPPPANSASFVPTQARRTQAALSDHLRDLPKLTIPIQSREQLGVFTPVDRPDLTPSTARRRAKTPVSAIRHFSGMQTNSANLRSDPYHYGGVASPTDLYRTDTPFSATDIPVTLHAIDPVARDVSQSVPAEMRYGESPGPFMSDPITRPNSSQAGVRPRHHRQNSFTPTIAPLPEFSTLRSSKPVVEHRPEPAVKPLRLEDVQYSGMMRKRKTTKMLRHEWQDHHFVLKGTQLAMHQDAAAARALEVIDVDEYAVACSSLASSSKLSAAFKRSILGKSGSSSASQANESAFAFSLVPQAENKNLFASNKSHHFSVTTRDQRIDWMRELMLAKALKKGKDSGNEIRVNGHLI